MPPNPTPHRTPLKRVSQGSLFALSRSGVFPDAPHGLGFLGPAMSEFLDETESLQANIKAMENLSSSLATFNESFASWLYIMNMNALTTDWLQAPTDTSFSMAKRRAEDLSEAMESLRSRKQEVETTVPNGTAMSEVTDAEITLAANITASAVGQTVNSVLTQKKKAAKPKLTVKEKKQRNLEIERIISCLPLEFRGSDPSLRQNMESVIVGVLDSPLQTVKLTELIKPPNLTQARVNKCLIALTNRKIVRKDNSTGTVLYHWQGVP